VSLPDDAFTELTALAAVVLGQTDVESALREICEIATRAVPGAEGASVTTFAEGRPAALANDAWACGLDELQYAEHEGPCLDAYRTGNLFRVRDLAADQRWPSYLPRAVEYGARSMMSLPMAAEGSVIGALNLYSRSPDAFDADAVSVGEIVAAHAGLACQVSAAYFGHRALAEQMADAMRSRAVIEQAKGIVMAARKCDAEGAFEELVEVSQTSHRKLHDVAADIVARATKG
jgi:GAF domain-containing protein